MRQLLFAIYTNTIFFIMSIPIRLFCCLIGLLIAPSMQAGGFILVTPSQHQTPGNQNTASLFPLEARSLQMQAQVRDQIATTTIKQVFYNPTNQQLEGHFLFPVPKGVAIIEFEMLINGKSHKAELLDAKKARGIYEAIVRRSKDPALLEYYHQQLFRVRIFPILPQKEQVITLSYTEVLFRNNETVQYQFPLHPDKHASKHIEQVSIQLDLQTEHSLKTFYCPTHETEITRKGNNHAVLGYEGTGETANRDFKCYFNVDNQIIGMSLLAYRQKQEKEGFFFVNLSPGMDEKATVLPKDVVFVIDKSGSMSGKKMNQAKSALRFCINHLNPEDRFEVVAFSTEATALFGQVTDNQPQRLKEALTFLDDIDPIGGTNIEEALTLALDAQKTQQKRPFFVIFLTDGKATIGETNKDKLQQTILGKNSQQVRIFTFGIGTNINTSFLDALTQATNAYRTYVLPDEDIEVKVSDFYTKVASPILTNFKIQFSPNIRVADVHYERSDLFRGESISILGRYKGIGKGTITLTGTMNGQQKTYTYNVNMPEEATEQTFIPNLWAARKVGYLLDQIRLHGKSEELVQSVTKLAKKYGIITPYTSYLIIEDEEVAMQQQRLPLERQVLRSRVRGPILHAPIEQKSELQMYLNSNVAEEVDLMEKSRNDSGKAPVQASQKAESYNRASNLGAIANNQEQLEVRDVRGNVQNLGGDIVQVQGRAIYQNNGNWIDANLSTPQNAQIKMNKIQFGTAAYFKLAQDRRAAEFLALGNNVSFVLDNIAYQVYE